MRKRNAHQNLILLVIAIVATFLVFSLLPGDFIAGKYFFATPTGAPASPSRPPDSIAPTKTIKQCDSCQDCTQKAQNGNVHLKLKNDITHTSGDYCIVIGNDNIVLDCVEHEIKAANEYSGGGVHIANKNNIEIRNCNFGELENGIYIDTSEDITVHDNSFNNNVYGVDTLNSDIKISKSSFTSHSHAIMLDKTSADISDNFINSNGWGISVYKNSKDTYISGNILAYNTWSLDIIKSADLNIAGNKIFGDGEVNLYESFNIKIENNLIFSGSKVYGSVSSDIYLKSNTVCSGGTIDIHFYESSNIFIENNVCDHKGIQEPCSSDCSGLEFCEDTDFDEGLDFGHPGDDWKGSIYVGSEHKAEDYCIDSETLMEYYCIDEEVYASRTLNSEYLFGNKTYCHDGAFYTDVCHDSDYLPQLTPYIPGDEKYYVQGTVSLSYDNNKYSDECVGSNTLKEYYCNEDGTVNYKLHDCNCLNGACSDVGLMFKTSRSWRGNLNGIAGADSRCQEMADRVNFGGTWKAIISDSSTSVLDRFEQWFSPDQVFTRMHGDVVATSISDLFDGNIDYPIKYSEDGYHISPNIGSGGNSPPWTGSTNLGQSHILNCNDWLSLSGDGEIGVGLHWLEWMDVACSSNKESLYCVRVQ